MQRASLKDIKNCLKIPTIIKFLFFFLLVGISLANGGKGHGAFLFANAIVFTCALFYLFHTSKDWSFQITPWYIIPLAFFLCITVNLFTTVYLHVTLLEWVRLVGYGTFFFILLALSALDRKKFSSFYQHAIWLIIGIGILESVVVLWQALQGKLLQGTMPNPNLASGFMAFSFIFLISFLIMRPVSFRMRIALTTILLIIMLALLMIHSRGVFFALLVAVILLLKKRPRLLRFASIVVISMLFIALIKGNPVDKFLKISDTYGYQRFAIWQSTLSMIEEHPLAGCGLGNYGLFYPRYSLPHLGAVLHYGKVTRFAHNEFLDIAATAGIPAFIFLLITVFIILYKGWKGYKKECSESWLLSSSYVAFLFCILHSIVDFNLHLPAISFSCILMAAYITSADKNIHAERKVQLRWPARVSLAIFYTVLLSVIGTFFIAFQYKKQATLMDSLRFPAHSVIYRYHKAIFYNPLDSYYHYELGRLYAKIYADYKRVEYAEKALQEFSAASQLNPEEAKFYEKGFYLCAALDLPHEYIEPLFREAQKRGPHNVQLMSDFAYVYMQKGFLVPAKQLLKQAVRIEPNFLPGYYNLAIIHEKNDQFLGAENLYRYLISKRTERLEKFVQSDFEQRALAVDWGDISYRLGLMDKKVEFTKKSSQVRQ